MQCHDEHASLPRLGENRGEVARVGRRREPHENQRRGEQEREQHTDDRSGTGCSERTG